MPELIEQGLWGNSPEGKVLLGSCCSACGTRAFPSRRVCPNCCSEKQEQAPLSRSGKVFSYTRIYIPMAGMDETPYLVGYVLLDDGISVPARLKYFDDEPQVGTALVLEVGPVGRTDEGEEIAGYYFRPVRGGEVPCPRS